MVLAPLSQPVDVNLPTTQNNVASSIARKYSPIYGEKGHSVNKSTYSPELSARYQ